MLTLIGEVRGLLSVHLPCSNLGARRQEKFVAGGSIRQAQGELSHIGEECLQLETTQPGTIDYTHTDRP